MLSSFGGIRGKTGFLLLAVPLILGLGLSAKGQDIEWLRQFGSPSDDYAYGVMLNSSGVFLAGATDGDLGGVDGPYSDMYVRRYDFTGHHVWTRQLDLGGYEDGRGGIAGDREGNLYVAGVGTDTGVGGLLASFAPQGTLRWISRLKTWFTAYEYINGVAVDPSDAIYVAGSTDGVFPSELYRGGHDAFVAKYDSMGSMLWIKQFGTSSDDYAFGVTTDEEGSVYVTGSTGGNLAGGQGGSDVFIRKYSASGEVAWTRQFGTSGDDLGYEVSVGGSRVILTGATSGSLPGYSNNGSSDVLAIGLTTGGDKILALQFGGWGQDAGYGLTTDAEGNFYLTGRLDDRTFLRRYTAAGILRWARTLGDNYPTSPSGFGLYLDQESLYLVGDTSGDLGGQGSFGGRDAFIAKYVQRSCAGTTNPEANESGPISSRVHQLEPTVRDSSPGAATTAHEANCARVVRAGY